VSKSLPPYSGEDALCPKCSNIGAYTEWLEANRLGASELDPERLRRCCSRCDYTWNEALNPPAATA
jgi:hypothetical protein